MNGEVQDVRFGLGCQNWRLQRIMDWVNLLLMDNNVDKNGNKNNKIGVKIGEGLWLGSSGRLQKERLSMARRVLLALQVPQ